MVVNQQEKEGMDEVENLAKLCRLMFVENEWVDQVKRSDVQERRLKRPYYYANVSWDWISSGRKCPYRIGIHYTSTYMVSIGCLSSTAPPYASGGIPRQGTAFGQQYYSLSSQT